MRKFATSVEKHSTKASSYAGSSDTGYSTMSSGSVWNRSEVLQLDQLQSSFEPSEPKVEDLSFQKKVGISYVLKILAMLHLSFLLLYKSPHYI